MMKTTLCSLLLVAAWAGCSTSRPSPVATGPSSVPTSSVTITGRERGAFVALKPKGTLTVALEANKSAGYYWKLAQPLDPAILQLVSSNGNELPPIALAPDNVTTLQPEQWVFKAVGPGTAKVRMIYSRPDQALNRAVTYDFTVNAE